MSAHPFGRAAIGGERRVRAAEDLRWLILVAAVCVLLGCAGVCWIVAGRTGLI